MLILTAKVNKKRLITALLILVVSVAVIAILKSGGDNAAPSASLSAVVKNNDQRVAYLNSLGWKVSPEPIEEQTVVIPKDFDDVYADYNGIQKAQGFDLSKYRGLEAVRYTYEVLNYPSGDDTVVADMIVYRNQIIAGDVQSPAIEGFMSGLNYPKS